MREYTSESHGLPVSLAKLLIGFQPLKPSYSTWNSTHNRVFHSALASPYDAYSTGYAKGWSHRTPSDRLNTTQNTTRHKLSDLDYQSEIIILHDQGAYYNRVLFQVRIPDTFCRTPGGYVNGATAITWLNMADYPRLLIRGISVFFVLKNGGPDAPSRWKIGNIVQMMMTTCHLSVIIIINRQCMSTRNLSTAKCVLWCHSKQKVLVCLLLGKFLFMSLFHQIRLCFIF